MAVFDRFLPKRQAGRNVPEEPTSVQEFRSDFHRAIDDVFRRAWMEPFGVLEPTTGFHPQVDVSEDENNIYVTADLPGLSRDDLDIRIEGQSLVLRGEKKEEKTTEERGWHRTERSYGSFVRRLPLPYEVKEDQCDARYHEGVLKITLPKTEQARSQSRRIEVRG